MMSATRVPMWSITVSPSEGSSQPSMTGTITRWPLEEIGRNSVSPWTRPRTISRTTYRSEPCPAGRVNSAGGLQRPDSFSTFAGPLLRDRRDHVEEQRADAVEVGLEEAEHLGLGDGLRARFPFHTRVVVGDEGDGGVTDAQLPGQVRLGVLGHVDDLPPLVPVPAR